MFRKHQEFDVMKVQLAVLRWKLQRQDTGNNPGWVSLVQTLNVLNGKGVWTYSVGYQLGEEE